MAITTVAPVAPTDGVVKVLDTFRDTGLGGGAITTEILGRLGMGVEIARRVLQTLRLLDYLEEDGQPTPEFIAFRQAGTAEYRQVLADHLFETYAPVFAITGKNLEDKTSTEIEDAFRSYSPASLRKRMVTLFLGLCQYAGIAENVPTRKPGPKGERSNGPTAPRSPRPPTPKRKTSTPVTPPAPPAAPAATPTAVDAAKQKYVDLLIEKAASQDVPDQDLLDRIERALGIGGVTS